MRTKSVLGVLFLTLLVGTLLFVGRTAPAYAKRWTPPPAPTLLVIPIPKVINLGDPLNFYAQLRDSKGNMLSNYAIDMTLDGTYFGQARTDANGVAAYQSSKKLTAGDHVVSFAFAGSKEFLPTSKARKLTIQPAVVTVQTLPAMAGVTFNMDGRDFVSGPDGVARISINKVGKYTLSVLADRFYSPDVRIEFGRWEAESYQPFRDVDVPYPQPIQAGLNIFYKTGLTFVDLDGKPVDMKRVTKITIKSIQGDVFSYTDGSLHWIPVSRIARRGSGLEVTQLQYGVMNVTVDGSNVVNQAQQRFYGKPNDIWKVTLLLYSMKIGTSDGLFGTPVGKSIQVEFPDGEVHTYPLDAKGTTEIRSLARGIYHIKVIGVKGMASTTPVALSRNQEVNLKEITQKDEMVAGVAGFIVMIGLLLLGRPWLLIPGLRRTSKVQHHHKALPEAPGQTESEGYVTIHYN